MNLPGVTKELPGALVGRRWLVREDEQHTLALDEVEAASDPVRALCLNASHLAGCPRVRGLAVFSEPRWDGDLYTHFVEFPNGYQPLAARSRLEKTDAFRLGYELMRLVRAAQKVNLCHLTLSSRSVLWRDSELLVQDFWWAHDSDGCPLARELGPYLAAYYPPHARPFAAPEALRGAPCRESDFFSVAALMVRCLGVDSWERAVLEGAGLSPQEAGLVRAMLDRDPGSRPKPSELLGLLSHLGGVEFPE
ncbi:MAG: hypothetical protein HY319_16135 [Armatimonadetes bacterium]|nr:hypothetical protein [Armatimonadota bacterium]